MESAFKGLSKTLNCKPTTVHFAFEIGPLELNFGLLDLPVLDVANL